MPDEKVDILDGSKNLGPMITLTKRANGGSLGE